MTQSATTSVEKEQPDELGAGPGGLFTGDASETLFLRLSHDQTSGPAREGCPGTKRGLARERRETGVRMPRGKRVRGEVA